MYFRLMPIQEARLLIAFFVSPLAPGFMISKSDIIILEWAADMPSQWVSLISLSIKL